MTTSDDTRQRLLDAAGPLFAEQGLKATTVRNICDRAGVNPLKLRPCEVAKKLAENARIALAQRVSGCF